MAAETPGHAPPRRRLRHRVPTSVRQHWKVAAALVVFVAVLATAFGSVRVRPYITGDATITASAITDNITGTVDLFDTSVDHEVSLKISDAEYQEMISSYQDDGDKVWVTADITIDGTLVTDVAVRLKGNSTLMGLRGNAAGARGGGPGGGGREGMVPPEGMRFPEGMAPPRGMVAEGAEGRAAGTGQAPTASRGMGGGPVATASADDPLSLPLLVSFDKNYEGRAYQGLTEVSVRPGSPVLNEAMALSLTAETGQPTQRYMYTVYSVNDSATTTRLLLEHPDETYANALFDSDGYLYKADANSRFEYVGDDQSDYVDQFKQVNSTDSGTVQPLIDFLKWLGAAGDEEFDAELADWVDTESLARYLATQNLLVNGDDMSGPGQNYYLWYDLDTKKLSVVSWDLNLAMQGAATAGPTDSVSIGGTRGGNELKTRFLASEAFAPLYLDAYWDLYDQLYGSGRAAEVLDEVAASIPVSDTLTAEALQSSVESMRTWIGQRADALAALRAG